MSNDDLIATLLDTAEIEGPGTMGNLLRMAAERLLKEQEPRVLSPDELFYMEHRCVYFEHRNNQVYSTEPSIVTSTRSFSPPILGRQYNFIREHKIKSTHWEIDYNKASNYGWRAWSYQPTEEQRKAVKWE